MLIQRNSDNSYSVTGNGPMRAIAVEAADRKQAMQAWVTVFGNQYAEAEGHTHASLEREAYLYDQ